LVAGCNLPRRPTISGFTAAIEVRKETENNGHVARKTKAGTKQRQLFCRNI
jgi:hypothetical protein